jgi:hypothetical protein
MTNAPEKIWVDPTGVDELDMYIAHASNTMDYLNMDVEYTRTDIADARVKNLEDALSALIELNDNHSPFGGEMYHDRVERTWDKARAALKETNK